eukprot:6193554-Pleurochrysis_carterae.AAC.1
MALQHAEKAGLLENILLDEPCQESYHGQVLVLAARIIQLDMQTSSKWLWALRTIKQAQAQEA